MTPDRERMLDLIVRWEEARAQGQDPRPEDLCGDCAELLSGFRRQVERLGEVEWLNGPIETAATTPGGARGRPETTTCLGCWPTAIGSTPWSARAASGESIGASTRGSSASSR